MLYRTRRDASPICVKTLTFKKSQIYLAFCLQSRTFAAVKVIRRQISACVLLAVFLPMLIFSSLHIHEIPQTTDTECSDCVHHNCHGHLSVMATWAHDCVLCQFLTLPMLTAVMMAVMVYVHVCKNIMRSLWAEAVPPAVAPISPGGPLWSDFLRILHTLLYTSL